MSQTFPRAKVQHFVDQGHQLKGIVHVGAHHGEEFGWYLYHVGSPVLGFEAVPSTYDHLAEVWGFMPEVRIVNAALGDRDGTIEMLMPVHLHPPFADDTMSASALDMDRESGYPWGDRHYGKRMTVPLLRFDSWATADRNKFYPSAYNTLVIDVQGMELDVLKGFGVYLTGFDFLNIECSETPIYKGEAPARDVIAWLDERGFRQDSPITSHDDIMFVRKGL